VNPTKALSIRAPWWWFILHAGKDIENRDWSTNFRGTVYVHASKWWSLSGVIDDTAEAEACYDLKGEKHKGVEVTYRQMRDLGGCIVGQVDIVDCVQLPHPKAASPWFFGDYGFVLANPVAFAHPVPCKGALGFFTVPPEVLLKLPAAA